MMNKLRNLYLKDDRLLLVVALVTLVGVFALMALGKISIAQGSTFLVAAFGFPSLVGVRSPASDVVLVEDESEAPPTKREGPPPLGGALLALLGIGALLAVPSSCAAPAPTTPEQGAASAKVADAAYKAQLLACVDATHTVYPTRAESDACLERTRAAWHRLPDGGADRAATDGGAR